MKQMKVTMRLLLVVAFFSLTHQAFAQAQAPAPTADEVKASYTKMEVQIPMRDGVKLFTSIYMPKDR